MGTVREKWTDERLDDLNKKVDDGFKRIDERFVGIDERFASIDQRFIHLERTMTHWFIALVGIQVTSSVTILGFISAQS